MTRPSRSWKASETLTRYELFLFLHVAAAIIWLGAGFTLDLLVYRGERSRDRGAQLAVYMHMEWLATRLFIPSSLAVLLFGIVLVADSPWSFSQLWIVLGLIGYLVSFGMGIGYFKPEGERIGAIVEEKGPDAPELDARIRRLNAFGRFELLVLFLVVVVMVAKPTSGDAWTLAIGAAILAAGLALTLRTVARGATETAAVAQQHPG